MYGSGNARYHYTTSIPPHQLYQERYPATQLPRIRSAAITVMGRTKRNGTVTLGRAREGLSLITTASTISTVIGISIDYFSGYSLAAFSH